MSLETCQLCNQDCTPWVKINGHICNDCYANTKRLWCDDRPFWIDVKDKLPDLDIKILIWYEKEILMAERWYHYSEDGKETFQWWIPYRDILNKEDVKFWMPLPSSPETNDDN